MFNRFKKWADPRSGKKNGRLCKCVNRSVVFVITVCLVNSSFIPAYANDDAAQEKMLRIAEVLGSLHFLRNLCGENSLVWREQMDELIAKENPAEAERLRLISNFNRGYRSYSDTYKRCTPSALAAIDSYLKEGAQLTKELVSRYGN
ncbi:TIGR02301 family protein [Paenochrobactrum pullorum]|uniref:TIGR02301 family protein n=1 Tax=Paenochrobactrum pullorum TaxID=1324351 RepID=UPI0035BC3B0D